jgi:hypothetical protein
VGLGIAALHTTRSLRADVGALRAELTGERVVYAEGTPRRAGPSGSIPAQEIRSAVAEALAAERERELAEARAYWAEQDARDGDVPGPLLGDGGLDHETAASADEELLDALLERYLLSDVGFVGPAREGCEGREGVAFVPRQPSAESVDAPDERVGEADEPAEEADAEAGAGAFEDSAFEEEESEQASEAAELAAARRRHPSHPGYTLTGEPVEEHHRRTSARLAQLAEARTPVIDVRPGPLGTLDVFLFADGTTLCLSPSHRQAAERLAAAVRSGPPPVLMGGSGISGAYALTFSCGEESIYLLADRVVATSRQR